MEEINHWGTSRHQKCTVKKRPQSRRIHFPHHVESKRKKDTKKTHQFRPAKGTRRGKGKLHTQEEKPWRSRKKGENWNLVTFRQTG